MGKTKKVELKSTESKLAVIDAAWYASLQVEPITAEDAEKYFNQSDAPAPVNAKGR